jgi:hypothetical protein
MVSNFDILHLFRKHATTLRSTPSSKLGKEAGKVAADTLRICSKRGR